MLSLRDGVRQAVDRARWSHGRLASDDAIAVAPLGAGRSASRSARRAAGRSSRRQPQPARQPASSRPAGAQPPQPPASRQQPTFRAGINFVRVDVIVDRQERASRSRDLTQADFEVLEDGKPQTIETFKLIKIDGDAEARRRGAARRSAPSYDEESEAARDDVRLFVIFLDDYHVRRGVEHGRARSRSSTSSQKQLGPIGPGGADVPADAGGGVDVHAQPRRSIVAAPSSSSRGASTTTSRATSSRSSTRSTRPQVVERIRNQVTLSALESLVTHLGSLREGRKAIILVSEGFTQHAAAAAARPDRGDARPRQPERGNPFAGANDPTEDRARVLRERRPADRPARGRTTRPTGTTPRSTRSTRAAWRPVEFDIDENVGPQTDRELLQLDDGHAAHAGGRDRRPRHRQPERPRSGAQAGRPRLERVLPDRLQLDAGARPTGSSTRSRCASSGRACRCARARATGRSRPRT